MPTQQPTTTTTTTTRRKTTARARNARAMTGALTVVGGVGLAAGPVMITLVPGAAAAGTVNVRTGEPVAGMTLLGQDRSVHVLASATPLLGSQTKEQSAAAPAFDPFSASPSVSVVAGQVQDQSTAFASASQDSSLAPGLLSVAGSVEANTSAGTLGLGTASADATFDVTFGIDSPLLFTLSGKLDTYGDPAVPENIAGTISLIGPGGKPVIPAADVTAGLFTETGTLSPGVYALHLSANVTSNDEADNLLNYGLTFKTTPQTAGGTGGTGGSQNPPPPAIPLPPMAYTGLIVLGGVMFRGVKNMRGAKG